MDSLHQANRTYRTLTSPEYLGVGSYLLISGVYVGLVNILGLAALIKYRKNFGVSAIAEASLILGDLAVAGLHPFSGSASILNKWIWGPIGCQMYAFFGFLFGTFQMVSVAFIAIDRYIATCKTPFDSFRATRNYAGTFALLFAYSLFWAAMPLLGWASYALTRVQISCTIDWMRVDTPFTSYVTAYLLCNVAGAAGISSFCYKKVYDTLKTRRDPVDWVYESHSALILLGRCFITTISCLPYGVVVLMALAGRYEDIPDWVTVLPPNIIKFAGIFNPICYIIGSPKFNAAVRKLLGWPYNQQLLVDEEVEKTNLTTTGVDPMTVRNCA